MLVTRTLAEQYFIDKSKLEMKQRCMYLLIFQILQNKLFAKPQDSSLVGSTTNQYHLQVQVMAKENDGNARPSIIDSDNRGLVMGMLPLDDRQMENI